MDKITLDVREKEEFVAEHIPNSALIPLSQFNQIAPGFLQTWGGKEILIICQSGGRAQIAQKQIEHLGFGKHVKATVFGGGLNEWKQQGKPTTRQKKAPLPLMRQIQLVAGGGILLSTLLSLFVNSSFAWIAVFFGAGLVFAGATGFCGLGILLSKMPWNKSASS